MDNAADAIPVLEVATFSTIDTSVSDLITFAYGLHPKQITAGRAGSIRKSSTWMRSPMAKVSRTDKQKGDEAPGGSDKKELSVYAIVVGKGGPKLIMSEGDPNGLPGLFRGLGVLPARKANMGDFAGVMQAVVLDRPVVDQTGLAGRFDFTLTWTPDEFQFSGMGARVPPPADTPQRLRICTRAIQQQLGLRIESAKAPVEVFVIDRQKPTEN